MLSEVDHRARVGRAHASLMKVIRASGAGVKLPTVHQLCDRLDVTRTQLEQAIVRIERAGLLRRRRGSGIYVTDRIGQKTLGVVFGGDIFKPHFSPFWSMILQSFDERTRERNLVARAYLDIPRASAGLGAHDQLVEDLEEHRLDGVLLLSPRSDQDHAGQLRAGGLPLVVFGGDPRADWSVNLNWGVFFARAAEGLARLRCRRLGLMGSPGSIPALRRAMARVGLRDLAIDDWSYETWASAIPGAGTRETCASRLAERMAGPNADAPLPDVLLSLDDTMTRGAITALYRTGRRPGRDVAIISIANAGSPVLEPFAADITTVDFVPRDCAVACVAMLEALVDGRTPPKNPALVPPRRKS